VDNVMSGVCVLTSLAHRWCYSGQDRSRNRQDYVVRDIDIVRQSGQAASEICIMTTAGMFVVHRGKSSSFTMVILLNTYRPFKYFHLTESSSLASPL